MKEIVVKRITKTFLIILLATPFIYLLVSNQSPEFNIEQFISLSAIYFTMKVALFECVYFFERYKYKQIHKSIKKSNYKDLEEFNINKVVDFKFLEKIKETSLPTGSSEDDLRPFLYFFVLLISAMMISDVNTVNDIDIFYLILFFLNIVRTLFWYLYINEMYDRVLKESKEHYIYHLKREIEFKNGRNELMRRIRGFLGKLQESKKYMKDDLEDQMINILLLFYAVKGNNVSQEILSKIDNLLKKFYFELNTKMNREKEEKKRRKKEQAEKMEAKKMRKEKEKEKLLAEIINNSK